MGPFIVVGPIICALAGASGWRLNRSSIGTGMPEYEAKQYQEKMKGGNILISVHTEDGTERTRATEIFKNAGAVSAAEDIVDGAYGAVSAPVGMH